MMKSKLLVLVLLAFFKSAYAFAYPPVQPVDTIDRRLYAHAKNAPDDAAQDIDKLVAYLKQPAVNQRDIVRAFSYWIMQNISYDVSGFMNNVYNTEGIDGTLKNRKGVCQDYSELFKAMCDRADIKCYIVSGYAKAFDYRPGSPFQKANHAWNVVCLDNNYQLLDLTWGSGYIQYTDGGWRYYLKPDPSQFFASPEVFVEKHLPAEPQWQLLTHPVTMKAFLHYETHQEMLRDTLHYYSYVDTISSLEKMDQEARELKEADAAYSFYPVLGDYAYHYYNQAVTFSNSAIDAYNSAVNSYNKSINDNNGAPTASGDYNRTVVTNAINNYSKAIKLLKKINGFSDGPVNASAMLDKCYMGLDASNELLKTLK